MPTPHAAQLRVEVTDEDTLCAAARLHSPVVLCFASGRNPGGGVAASTSGQEEHLCRMLPWLLPALQSADAVPFYVYHRDYCGPLNSDYCVYVAGQPAVVACAAPNARDAVRYGYTPAMLAVALQGRAARVLDVCAANGHRNVVLGAWGCGAFGNDPRAVAQAFNTALAARDGMFDHVVFAIYDPVQRQAFAQ